MTAPSDAVADSAVTPAANPPALAGERVAFTGTLASMTHRQAQTRVEECGGTAAEHVSRRTTMLVVGEEGWPLEADGAPSLKLLQAERWRQSGVELRIVRESEWLEFVGLDARRPDLERWSTPAMLSRALGVSVHEVRRWERLGLIRPVRRVCRLPYFDFREAASARRLTELLEAGVPVRQIQSGLTRLRGFLGELEFPLAQLDLLARDRRVVYRDPRGRLKTPSGQRLFDFEPASSDRGPATSDAPEILPLATADRSGWDAEQWFEEGRRLADAGELAGAIEALRLSLMAEHDAPEVHFHLADALYRLPDRTAALERYHVAVELDHQYVEAWTQIGCLHAELGQPAAAIDAFRVALEVHPDYPDAHLRLAEALCGLGRAGEAAPHWRKYLEFDRHGPWADAARERLADAPPPPG